MKNKEVIRKNFIAILLILMLPALTVSMNAKAANIAMTAKTQNAPILVKAAGTESSFPKTDDELVEIRVEGTIEEPDRQALIERLNEIRAEACQEGVPNPINGEPLRTEDYVPLEWAEDLEKIAILRAVESTILQDHVRPEGSECFSAAPEGVPYTMETLAWGFGSAASAIEGWYSEKEAYVGESGTPAGHYMALINPENRFVGIADFQPEWQRDACAGAFASHGTEIENNSGTDNEPDTGAGTSQVAGTEQAEVVDPDTGAGITYGTSEWSIPLLRSYLPSVIQRAVEVTVRRIISAAQL